MVDDFGGELRELRDEDCGEPRAVRAFVGDEAARAADLVEVRRQRVFRVRRNPGAGTEQSDHSSKSMWVSGLEVTSPRLLALGARQLAFIERPAWARAPQA